MESPHRADSFPWATAFRHPIKDILRTVEESYRMISPSSLGIRHHSLEINKAKQNSSQWALSEKPGEGRTGTGDGGILALLFCLCIWPLHFSSLLTKVSLDIFFSSCCFFSLFHTEVSPDEYASGWGHDCPLHIHAYGSDPDSSGH